MYYMPSSHIKSLISYYYWNHDVFISPKNVYNEIKNSFVEIGLSRNVIGPYF